MIMYPAYTWTDSHPHHSEMNPSHINLSPLYQPWSYAGNYPQPVPHGCCNHTYYGGGPYGFQPHYAHYPPPPLSFHPHGFYSPFPGAYPVPPQHYSVNLPRYDYDKNNHAPHHCCECHHRKDEKIKEESQFDNKKSDSLVPSLLKDSPDYPIMWVPRGYTSNNADSKVKEMEKYSRNPVLVKHHEPSKKVGNGEMARDEHGGDGDRFPFQIFWLPSKNDEVRKDTKENNLDLIADKGLSDEKTIKNTVCSGNETECKTSSKHAAQKEIQVKQVATNDEKKSTKVLVNSDSMDNGSKASPKTSKLPPVCLRIDPLPRKKKTSRSPSPSERERSNAKSSQQQAQVLKKSQDELIEGNIKTVDHADEVERGNIADHADIVPRGEGAGSEKEKAEEKKNLTEDEAALIIQSVYRGFEVRKSQPLKKLRQIYQVRKQVFELRNRILDLESFGVDGKKELIIGETIMSLLLKLDTIQGLHPCVREVRKSVAKELVGLQEKLDPLASVKSETPTTCGAQQVDVIQENSDQAHAQLDLLENHGHKATESQYDDDDDDAEAPNLEQQLEKTNADEEAIQDKFETDSDMVIGENHEVESTMSQLELPKGKLDEVPTECDEATRLCKVEIQEGVGEPEPEKFDKASAECGEATVLCKTHEMETTDSEEGCNAIGEPELESHNEKLACEFDGENVSMVKMVSELPTATTDALEELIRELRGKVKDLEKKLSKNKKIKVNKCSSRKRSRGCVVQKNMVTKA